jgi:hypothetical protein
VNDLRVPPPRKQAASAEAAEIKGQTQRRRRLASVHAGARQLMDAAMEARCDSENVSAESEVRRPDVQDLFAWMSRREIRKMQSILRTLDERLRAIEAELRGIPPASRRAA